MPEPLRTFDHEALIGEGKHARGVLLLHWPYVPARVDDMVPDARCVELLDGVIGHVQARHSFELYNWHWGKEGGFFLLGTADLEHKTPVVNELPASTSTTINPLRKHGGQLLLRNGCVQLLNPAEVEAAMAMILGLSLTEGVVAHAKANPFSAGSRILFGEPVVGAWVDRERMHKHKSRDEDRFTTRVPVTLAQLPHLAGEDPADYARRWRGVAAAQSLARRGARVTGAAAARRPPRRPSPPMHRVRRQHPLFRGTPQEQAQALERYQTRALGVRRATRALRGYLRGERASPLRYPEGTHCPGALCRALPRALARAGVPPD